MSSLWYSSLTTPPEGITLDRVSRRREALAKIDAIQQAADEQPEAFASLDESYKAALNMITSPETSTR